MAIIVSVLIAAAGAAPLLAFSYDDVNAADARWNEGFNGTGEHSVWGTEHPVSMGLSLMSSLSASLGLWSTVSLVTARMFLSAEALRRVSTVEGCKLLVTWMNPIAASGLCTLVVSCVGFIPSYYYAGFVAFPFAVASSPQFFYSGVWYMISTFILVFISLALVYKVRSLGKRKIEG